MMCVFGSAAVFERTAIMLSSAAEVRADHSALTHSNRARSFGSESRRESLSNCMGSVDNLHETDRYQFRYRFGVHSADAATWIRESRQVLRDGFEVCVCHYGSAATGVVSRVWY